MRPIKVIDQVAITLSPGEVLSYLRDVEHAHCFEPSLAITNVTPGDADNGTFSARGRFMGFRWEGNFSYKVSCRGVHVEMIKGPAWLKFEQEFFVKSFAGSWCQLKQVEKIGLPFWARPLFPFLRIYVKKLVRRDLRNLGSLLSHVPARIPENYSTQMPRHFEAA